MYDDLAQTPGSAPAQLEAALENSRTRKTVDLLADMASDEVFVYGDKKMCRLRAAFSDDQRRPELRTPGAADDRGPQRSLLRSSPGRGGSVGLGAEPEADRHAQHGHRL